MQLDAERVVDLALGALAGPLAADRPGFGASLRDIKALDVVVGRVARRQHEWGALCRISFLVENLAD